MWRATWSITDHKFSDFYHCLPRESWKFQSIDTRISFISNHCFVLFFFSGLYLCTVLSQRLHSVHIFLIWHRLFEASRVKCSLHFRRCSFLHSLFITKDQSIFNSEPLFFICRVDIDMRLIIHYTIVLCINALLPGLVADSLSHQQSKVTLCKYKDHVMLYKFLIGPKSDHCLLSPTHFVKTWLTRLCLTFFMITLTVMLLLMLMTLTMLLTFLICYSWTNCLWFLYQVSSLWMAWSMFCQTVQVLKNRCWVICKESRTFIFIICSC